MAETEYERRLRIAHDQITVLKGEPMAVKLNILANVYAALLLDGYDRTDTEQQQATLTCGLWFADALRLAADKRKED